MTQINLLRQAKNLNFPEGFLINGQIVPSVSSGNLTVALKTLAGTDPSVIDPAFVRIGDTVRTITGPLNITINAGSNYFNAGSSELATKEIDYFNYLWVNNLGNVQIGISRIPYGTTYGDFSTTGSNEKFLTDFIGNTTGTNKVINIGRFSAILSAGAGYTWSTPSAGFQVINHYINETKSLESLGMAYPDTGAFVNFTSDISYKLIGNKMFFSGYVNVIDKGTGGGVIFVNLPFNSNGNYSSSIGTGRTEGGGLGGKMIVLKNYSYNKNFAIFTYDNNGTISDGTVSNFNGFTNI